MATKKRAGTPYDPSFFHGFENASYRSAKEVVPLLIDLFRPRSVLDVGCGVGTWLRAFSEAGVGMVFGRDGEYALSAGLHIAADLFEPTDLTRPFTSARKFDVVLSLEVAEHLPRESAPGFVRSLCESADVVVFSAAIPHQGGTHHVNCQWQSWWAGIFQSNGFRAYDLVRPMIWGNDRVSFWYQQNIVVYIKEGSAFSDAHQAVRAEALDLVHPQLYLSIDTDLFRLNAQARRAIAKVLAAFF
ncbi:MAG TPA: methyltransferase domain-containing protein [Pseudolabrys sp.]|nr:methyltransferase domain-containing protein [Pseudolabrys sp.]